MISTQTLAVSWDLSIGIGTEKPSDHRITDPTIRMGVPK